MQSRTSPPYQKSVYEILLCPIFHDTPIIIIALLATYYLLCYVLPKIIHNRCPNPINYLGRSFNHTWEYLQTSSLPNIPNCDNTYQLPYFRFIDSICGFGDINVFGIRLCLLARTYATSILADYVRISTLSKHKLWMNYTS